MDVYLPFPQLVLRLTFLLSRPTVRVNSPSLPPVVHPPRVLSILPVSGTGHPTLGAEFNPKCRSIRRTLTLPNSLSLFFFINNILTSDRTAAATLSPRLNTAYEEYVRFIASVELGMYAKIFKYDRRSIRSHILSVSSFTLYRTASHRCSSTTLLARRLYAMNVLFILQVCLGYIIESLSDKGFILNRT